MKIDLTREGLTKADDTLPSCFFEEPLGSKKDIITREQLEYMKDDYYRLRGWDKDGIPKATSPLTKGKAKC